MATQEEINNLKQILQLQRKTLSLYLSQLAMHGEAYAPPSILIGIENARLELKRTKQTLRGMNILVDDQPIDEASLTLAEESRLKSIVKVEKSDSQNTLTSLIIAALISPALSLFVAAFSIGVTVNLITSGDNYQFLTSPIILAFFVTLIIVIIIALTIRYRSSNHLK